jgi:hypothetical protein
MYMEWLKSYYLDILHVLKIFYVIRTSISSVVCHTPIKNM